MPESVVDNAVDSGVDSDDAVDDDDNDDDGDGDGDDDDDAVAGLGSCGSSCWVPSSREHTGPRNQASPGALAAGGTRLHVDETTWTTIDRYPRSIRAPGGEPLRGGQRCSRDSQGHGVTCHEDIPTNEELPSPGASHHLESRCVPSVLPKIEADSYSSKRAPTSCSSRSRSSHSRSFLFFLCIRLFFSAREIDIAKTDCSKPTDRAGEEEKRFATLCAIERKGETTSDVRATSSGTPDQGTASRSRGCSRRWTTTGKRNMERSMVSWRGVGRDRRRESERFERASRWPVTLPSRHGTTRRPYIDLCASGAEAGETERTNPTNERTNERTWNESRERKERSPLGGSAPRISNAMLRARTFVARFVTARPVEAARKNNRKIGHTPSRLPSRFLDHAPDHDREVSRFSLSLT